MEQGPIEDYKIVNSVFQRLEVRFSNVLLSNAYSIFFTIGVENN